MDVLGGKQTRGPFVVRRLKEFFTYLRGYFDSKTQETFIRQWCFEPLGGHYHGFHTRQLAVGIRKAGFGKIRMQPFYAFEPIPILQARKSWLHHGKTISFSIWHYSR